MVDVIFKDDGKQRWQSHTADLEISSDFGFSSEGFTNLNFTAWGENKEEAQENLRRQLTEAQAWIAQALSEI